jgi:hypothetical protein
MLEKIKEMKDEDLNFDNHYVLRYSCYEGYSEIVEYLINKRDPLSLK